MNFQKEMREVLEQFGDEYIEAVTSDLRTPNKQQEREWVVDQVLQYLNKLIEGAIGKDEEQMGDVGDECVTCAYIIQEVTGCACSVRNRLRQSIRNNLGIEKTKEE